MFSVLWQRNCEGTIVLVFHLYNQYLEVINSQNKGLFWLTHLEDSIHDWLGMWQSIISWEEPAAEPILLTWGLKCKIEREEVAGVGVPKIPTRPHLLRVSQTPDSWLSGSLSLTHECLRHIPDPWTCLLSPEWEKTSQEEVGVASSRTNKSSSSNF